MCALSWRNRFSIPGWGSHTYFVDRGKVGVGGGGGWGVDHWSGCSLLPALSPLDSVPLPPHVRVRRLTDEEFWVLVDRSLCCVELGQAGP